MERLLLKAIDDVINYLVSSKDYKECVKLKEQMKKSSDVTSLVEEIKTLQKQYVKNNYDAEIKQKLDCLEDRLKTIPIYVIYMQHLEKVNEMINYVKDEMNDYFYKLLNEL